MSAREKTLSFLETVYLSVVKLALSRDAWTSSSINGSKNVPTFNFRDPPRSNVLPPISNII